MNGLTGFRWRFWPTARAIGLALAVLLTTACGPRYEPPLRVGLGQWMGYETLFLARDLGYYPQLPLRLVELASSTQAMDGLKVGKLDVAGLTMDEALTLAHEGVPIAIIWVMDISAGADAVVARPDIRQLAEIKGKRVGVEQTALGAYMLTSALQAAGLDAAAIKTLHLPLDEQLAAYRRGEVDVLVTFDPTRQSLLQQGARVLFDSRQIPGEIVDVLVTRRETLACCADQLRQLLLGQQKAQTFLKNSPQEAVARMATRLGQTPAELTAALQGIELPDNAANRQLLLGQPPALEKVADKLAHIMVERQLLPGYRASAGLVDGRFAGEIKP